MKINKLIGIFIAVILVIIVAVVFFLSARGGGAQATIGDQKVNLMVVDTSESRAIGLSETKSLSDDQGMLFVFDEKSYPSFWMKGMDFPIDIIFLNDKKIVTIHENVQPPQKGQEDNALPLYQATGPSNQVLEVRAGFAKKYNVKVGDTIDLSL